MKATLFFEFPDDRVSFEVASKSVELIQAMTAFTTWMAEMKQDDKMHNKTLQTIIAEFQGILDDHDIELDC